MDRGLSQVDADVRPWVAGRLSGQPIPRLGPEVSQVTDAARHRRAEDQFREAIVNEALAHPAELRRLPAALWPWLATAIPHRRRHPIATLVLIKFPLRLAVAIVTLLVVSYVGAWMAFNDAVLGRFVSTRVSGLIEGELELGSIHWDLPLIVDLVTGQPTECVVEDVSVWEAYDSYGGQRTRRTAYAERLEVTLVLHEIIPWNRLGIPRFLDIPWVLHFPTVTTEDPAWFTVREYEDEHDERGEVRLLSLIDAFRPLDPDPDAKGLSFAVDAATLSTTTLEIDIGGEEGWANATQLSWANFELYFEAPEPHEPMEVLPFSFSVEGRGTRGALHIAGITLPYEALRIGRLETGLGDTPLGDVGFAGSADAAGSPTSFEGVLRHAFPGDRDPAPPMSVDLWAKTDDGGGLMEELVAELDLEPGSVSAEGVPIAARVWGLLDSPMYRLRADGLTLDAFGDPAWAVDDLVAEVTITEEPVPDRWMSRYGSDEGRLVVRFSELHGAALDGVFDLAAPEDPDGPDDDAPPRDAVIVMPATDDDPWLLAANLDVEDLNPAKFTPADPELAERLRGALTGNVDVAELVLLPPPEPEPGADTEPEAPSPRIDMSFAEIEYTRDRGPRVDGLPKDFTAEGRLVLDPTDGLDMHDLLVTTGGTRLSVDGGLDEDFQRLDDTKLELSIDDGRAFARAFDLDAYFAKLSANLVVSGPVGAPRSPPGRLVIDNLGLLAPPPRREGEPRPDRPDWLDRPDRPDRTDRPAFDPNDPEAVEARRRARARRRLTEAQIWLERGVLRVRSADTRLLGGRGSVDLWVYLFEHGELSNNPRVEGKIRLAGIRPGRLTDGQIIGQVDVDVTLDDGNGKPARIDDLVISGIVVGPRLRIAGTDYRDARMLFTLDDEDLEIEQLVLPVHRGVSPFHGPDVSIKVGELVARGSVSLDNDPKLDLLVGAQGVPLDVVARLLEVEAPVGGRIGTGTQLEVGGSLARPRVDGAVALEGLAVSGVVLGGGTLEVESDDFAGSDGLAAHREVRVEGTLAAADTGAGPLEWTVEAVAALGAPIGGTPTVDAEVDVGLDSLTLAAVLGDTAPPVGLTGAIEGVGAHVITCGEGKPMLSSCQDHPGGGQSLEIDLTVERTWLSDGAKYGQEPPCDSATTLCSDTRLDATLDWPVLSLDREWRLSTGGDRPARLAVSGRFDLSEGSEATTVADADCSPPPLGTTVAPTPDGSQANISGTVDLASLAPILQSYGITTADGRIDLDLALTGKAANPRLAGRATLASTASGVTPLSLELGGMDLPMKVTELDLRLQPGWLTAAGKVDVQGAALEFGTVRGESTGVGLSGACAGRWVLASEGRIAADLIEVFAGQGTAPRGSLTLDRLVVSGPGQDDDPIDRVDGTIRLRRETLALELTESVPTIEVTDGVVDFSRCRGDECGPSVTEGSIALWLGGKEGAMPKNRARTGTVNPPPDALKARIGARGRAAAWGVAHLPLDVSRAEGTAIRAVLTDASYTDYDARGRPVYQIEVSSDDLLLQGGDPLVLSGNVEADRARYVKDAVQGVEILTLTDEIEVPEAPPPTILRELQFDLRAQTDTPLRIENNVAHGVEAEVSVKVGGTYDAPEISGRFDIEPGGTVDIPFLTGTYEIQFGRVTLEREIEDAEVDILALRNEPVYIDNQARQIQLLLGGTVSAITWNCIAEGDTSGALDTSRGCLDYLVLGAGDVQVDSSDVQRLGGGGLANARKSLQVVGHVTEFDFGERIEDAAPRYESFVPDVRLRLGQIGPELEVTTPPEWFDFDWAQARFGWDYTRGYPGFLLLQSRELSFQLEILDPVTLEFSRDIRSYLNERIIFDPLRQRTLELRVDHSLPSLR